MTDDICCPEFNPNPFEEKIHVWRDKLFLWDTVFQIMHIPINMGTVITRMLQKIESANASPKTKDFLILCFDPSPWKSEVFMSVTKNIPNGTMKTITGTFVSKVFDGPYQDVPKWIKCMDNYLATKKQKAKKYFFHYAYCPRCMKKYGHNYCVAFAQVK